MPATLADVRLDAAELAHQPGDLADDALVHAVGTAARGVRLGGGHGCAPGARWGDVRCLGTVAGILACIKQVGW
ncbi:hypothetical protein GCM10025868_24410 [Angustibacter aerolatus]|uniref:Uncharacterized protein n=1 Tax=Angustibacter aerolatus TaxID=1162965 RepID=A0ABQ6JG50_9ACTN|nr:hypothetical protein GCM10025868_24410 [Angustibacter aerolatus]